ncbi:MAG: DNA polymerase III subunit delta [Candidatus Omnitrophica bacterium]|nr:DNA polymerase III subunit delta [Candidatus Omnitrophota bacterium]
MPTKIFPAYIFLGEEGFLKEEALEKLKSALLNSQTKDLNYSVFYGREKDFNFREMMGNLNTLPFLSKKRLVVLKDADSIAASFKKSILSYLEGPKPSSVFVIESPSPSIKGQFLLEASRHAHLIYYRRLTDSSINTWLVKKAASCGKKIAPLAIKAIKESLSGDLKTFSSNMDMIILYIGNRILITKQDIESVVGFSPLHTAFDLIGAIVNKDARKALEVFSFLKRDKKKETELLGLLAWNARMLLRIKEFLKIKGPLEMRKDLGLSPRMFDKILQNAAGFKKAQVLVLLDELIKADVGIKTGEGSALVMERLIAKMCA